LHEGLDLFEVVLGDVAAEVSRRAVFLGEAQAFVGLLELKEFNFNLRIDLI